jgi:hypothetical protein
MQRCPGHSVYRLVGNFGVWLEHFATDDEALRCANGADDQGKVSIEKFNPVSGLFMACDRETGQFKPKFETRIDRKQLANLLRTAAQILEAVGDKAIIRATGRSLSNQQDFESEPLNDTLRYAAAELEAL